MNQKKESADSKPYKMRMFLVGILLFVVIAFFSGVYPALRNTGAMLNRHPLTRDHMVSTWLRYGWWQIQSRFVESVEFEWIEGTKVIVKRGMHGFTGNIYTGLQDDEEMFFLLHFLRPGDLFVDVGANVGSYTILSSGVVGAKTVAFEPDLSSSSALKANIDINSIEKLVEVRQVAVGPEKGVISFTVDLGAKNRVAQESVTGSREVPMVRLDDSFHEEIPMMMKIDVEGFGLKVLQGAKELLNNPSLKVINIETVSDEVSALLYDEGFRLYAYDYRDRKLTALPQKISGGHWDNRLYVRDMSFVEDRLKTASKVSVLGIKY